MILNSSDLQKILNKNPFITNFNIDNINGCSYDITNSNIALRIKKHSSPISLSDSESINNMYEQIDISDGYNLKPSECILLVLNESFNLPNNISAHIRPRTSFNRLGINISFQHIHPGYNGTLNITVYNFSPNTYTITPNMKIGQIIFELLTDNVPENLLYSNNISSKYCDENGIQGSKIYSDFIGKVFRHFKGNYYYVEDVSLDSETKEYMIIYKTLYDRSDSRLWVRPAKMFFEQIDSSRSDNITGQKHRFELVENLSQDYTLK